jgi:predicted HTH transcriptional regulator
MQEKICDETGKVSGGTNVTRNVTKTRKEIILELIKKNNRTTTGEIASILNVSRMTIAREIAELKKQGILVHQGSSKGGFWEIVSESVKSEKRKVKSEKRVELLVAC